MEHPTPPRAGGPRTLPAGVLPLEPDDPVAIGGHRLVGRLGSGGMGIVYLGRTGDGGLAAVKTALPEDADDPHVRRRYQSEVVCARKAPPDRTARVLVDGTAETPPFIVTEYVDGPPLSQVVQTGGPLRADRLHALALGVAQALAAIHDAGLVHRDLKPANVLMTAAGPRVIDFGIAQQVAAAGGLTRAGVVMGSPGWIPPERLSGGPATAASDVFGWGCLMCYAATGRNPFGRGDADELARRVLHDQPDLRGLPDRLRSLVAVALAKDPAARPTAATLAARLGGRRPRALLGLGAGRIGAPRPGRVVRRLASIGTAAVVAVGMLAAAAALDDDGGGGAGAGITPPRSAPTTAPARPSVPRTRAPGAAVPPWAPGRTPAGTPAATPTGASGAPPSRQATAPVTAPSPITAPVQNPTPGTGNGTGSGMGNGVGKGNGNGGIGTGKGNGGGKGR